MIPLFIPSKDRAAQLDLLLRSIEKNCPIFNPYIIYQSSSQEFEAGYQKLNVELIKEQLPLIEEFKAFLLANQQLGKKLFGIATDDCVIYRKFEHNAKFIEEQFEDEDLFCFSLRLGLNTTVQDYTTGRLQPELSYYEEVEDCIKWNFKGYHPHDNNGYSGGQDLCLYRTDDVLSYFYRYSFSSLRDLESKMATDLRGDILREWMMSPRLSCAVNIPANNMQEPFIANGFNSFEPAVLNEKFLNGERISLEAIEKVDVKGCHQPINYTFEVLEELC